MQKKNIEKIFYHVQCIYQQRIINEEEKKEILDKVQDIINGNDSAVNELYHYLSDMEGKRKDSYKALENFVEFLDEER